MRWTPQRKDVLEALAADILHNYARGRVIVAIDGVDAAATASFARDVSAAIDRLGHASVAASTDDFQRPRSERDASSAAAEFESTYDYSTLRRILTEPFKLGGSTAFVTASFDAVADRQLEPKWLTAPDDAVLVLGGRFLNRSELRGLWNYSVWLEQPAEATAVTKLYAREKPSGRATAIIDNTDAEHPRRVFADSC